MKQFDAIYLSPHLDDAVYSCGARLFGQIQAGQRVLVITFFTATPPDENLTEFTRELKTRWGDVSDINAVRRSEDLEAARLLGFESLHLPFCDCVYRQGGPENKALYPTVAHIFADIHPAEADLPARLCTFFQKSVPDWKDSLLFAPLAAGHHVDHLLVRSMAFMLQTQGATVRFYEDYPYSDKPAITQAALAPFPARCREPETITFSDDALAAKVYAAACYTSQVSTFWHNVEEMTEAFRAQALAAGLLAHVQGYAENYWRIPTDCEEQPNEAR
ncbi:MAG: PIG-L deacetylase family protein [Anaerolineae bacterium]